MFALLLALSAGAAGGARRKVIIDQDAYGRAGSDEQSILMLLQSPQVEVLGITIPTGDGWRDEEVRDTLRMLEIAGRTDIPVYAGAVMPLVNTPARMQRWSAQYGKLVWYGPWLQNRPDPYLVPPSPAGEPGIKAAPGTAAEFMVRMVHKYPGQVTIIAAGPFTNLALAARLDAQFSSLARELVFMGGSFNPVPADNKFSAEYVNSPRLEFNMRFDPEASSIMLHEPWKRILEVPVDPTTPTLFTAQFIHELSQGKAPFDAYLARYGQVLPMWDEMAVAVWLDPSLITRSQVRMVDTDTQWGPGYGATLSWSPDTAPGMGEQPVQVVFAVDVPRFERTVLDLLKAPSPSR
jgi:inosine-uridine nucleoside N-ribohydrolase